MHWRPELAYFPCLLNLKRRRSNCSAKAKVWAGVCIFFLGMGDWEFFYITCYVSDQGKSASFLSEFKTQLRWLQELGIWEGYLTTITEFSLGQTLFLMLEAFLFRRVKIDIDILMMARTLVKQVRKHLGMYTFLFNRDTKCFFLL